MTSSRRAKSYFSDWGVGNTAIHLIIFQVLMKGGPFLSKSFLQASFRKTREIKPKDLLNSSRIHLQTFTLKGSRIVFFGGDTLLRYHLPPSLEFHDIQLHFYHYKTKDILPSTA